MKIKTGDILIVIFVLLFSCLLFVGKKEKGSFAILEINGKQEYVFDLTKDHEYTYREKYINVISVVNGKISVSYSDCPDKVCVHTGEIMNDGQLICCLPNKMLIKVVNSQNEVDVISG